MKLQPIIIAGIVLLLAGVVFLAAESRGRIFESRFGLICLVAIAALSFLGAYLQKSSAQSKNSSSKDDGKKSK